MFLFKKIDSLIIRIGLNIAVYGWIAAFAGTFLVAVPLAPLKKAALLLAGLGGLAIIVGSVITVVTFIYELTPFATKREFKKQLKRGVSIYSKIFPDGHTESVKILVENNQYYYIAESTAEGICGGNEKHPIPEESSLYELLVHIVEKHPFMIALNKEIEAETRRKPDPPSFDFDIKLGEYYDGGVVEQYISLRKDSKGYCIYENSWNYNANAEFHIKTKYIDDSYIEIGSFKGFVEFLKQEYPKYEIDRYVNDEEKLYCLFIDNAIALMADFLKNNDYDIEFGTNTMTIVKHSDDPCRFDEFVAKSDGVYNHIERAMGSYELTKRLTCSSLEVSAFITLAHFFATKISKDEIAHTNIKLIVTQIKKHIDKALENTSDCENGQWFIDHILETIE